MKLVVQRVKEAKVLSEGKVVGEIGKGLFVLLGVSENDNPADANLLASKVINMRIMEDEEGKMNLSIRDVGGEILVVSQFTLYADTNYGRRPSFIKAADPELAKEVYERFIEKIKEEGVFVATGNFGEHMEIESVASGPVTIILEYPEG